MKPAVISPRQGTTVAAREHFSVSRAMEYFSEAELVRQCGHTRSHWPLLILKEALDNGLDGCESAGVPPKITIAVDDDHLVINDNGAGIPPAIVKRICDFNSRTPDKSAYVSPSRGAMGNGSKLILAIPFALNRQGPSTTTIEACDVLHTITIDTDELRREPKIGWSEKQIVKTEGTTLRIPADSSCSQAAYRGPGFLQMVQDFAVFNPHAEFLVDYFGTRWERPALVPTGKWTPADPTSPHWYDPESFGNLIRSQIAADETSGRNRTLREFIETFRGLSGSTKPARVSSAAGLKGVHLKDLLDDQQKLRQDAVQALLTAMQEVSAPVKPDALGVLGDAYLRAQMITEDDSTFRYKRICGDASGRPFVVEAAFVSGQDQWGLKIGINSSVPLRNPLQQTVVGDAYGLAALLNELRVDFDIDPFEEDREDEGEEGSDGWNTQRPLLALHLCYPGFSFVDQGKASLTLPPALGKAVGSAVTDVTKNWTKYQKKAERSSISADKMADRIERSLKKLEYITQKEAGEQVIEGAHLKARGPLPAPVAPRQIYYAARKGIEELSGQPLRSQYFSQTLLTDFLKEHPDLTKDWDICWDDRGHFEEPHGGIKIGVGTASVREYLASRDPHVYGAILYSEKKGSTELLRRTSYKSGTIWQSCLRRG